MKKEQKIVCYSFLGLLWIAAQVCTVLLEDSGYDTILGWVSYFPLVYFLYKVRDKVVPEWNSYSQLRWLSLCIVCVNVAILSDVITDISYCIIHSEEELWLYIFMSFLFLPFIYFTLIADISIFHKWESEVFHIRCMLVFAILLCLLFVFSEVFDDEIRVMWAQWVDVIFYCTLLILYIIGFIYTFSSEAKLAFPIENRKIKWQEVVVPSMIVGGVFFSSFLLLIIILISD